MLSMFQTSALCTLTFTDYENELYCCSNELTQAIALLSFLVGIMTSDKYMFTLGSRHQAPQIHDFSCSSVSPSAGIGLKHPCPVMTCVRKKLTVVKERDVSYLHCVKDLRNGSVLFHTPPTSHAHPRQLYLDDSPTPGACSMNAKDETGRASISDKCCLITFD